MTSDLPEPQPLPLPDGRSDPALEVDLPRLRDLAMIGSSDADIARSLGVLPECLAPYAELIARHRADRRAHLRSFQWKAAKEGSASILALLGKFELGQREDADAPEEKIIVRRVVKRGD